MKKKVIKLNENDIENLVKKIIQEDRHLTEEQYNIPDSPSMILNEGFVEVLQDIYDGIRDRGYDIFYVVKALAKIGYNIPKWYSKENKRLEGESDDEYTIRIKKLMKGDVDRWLEKWEKQHPQYGVRRALSRLKKELDKLEDMTYDKLATHPDSFSDSQKELLLKNLEITDTGINVYNRLRKRYSSKRGNELNENDMENLVKKIIKKEKLNESIFDYDYDDDVTDIHDSLTYTSSDVTAASYYDEKLKDIIDEAINDGYQPSEEMVSLTRRLDYDISALEGAHNSVTRLVDIMLDEDEYKSQL